MFKPTKANTQIDMFKSKSTMLTGTAIKFFDNEKSWHNLFRANVTSRIDEAICAPLFAAETGSPNSSIRVLLAMMILKEGNGWSDAQLFEECSFNILIRSALGIVQLDDAIPTQSTYYLFRKKIVEYEKKTKINLIEKAFTALTKNQALNFEVSGKSIRMDSKLIGSNIAWLSRYEIIHQTLRLFCTDIKESIGQHPELIMKKEIIESLFKEEGNKVVYRSSSEEVKAKIQGLGLLANILIPLYDSLSSIHYDTLKRVFAEQFQIDEKTKFIIAKVDAEISANSVQSPHDADAHFRNKDGNKVKGCSVNLTETCDKEKLNLITVVEVKPASAADNNFLQSSIKATQEIVNDKIEKTHTDGAYNSADNQSFCNEENIELYLNAIQGAKSRFDLALNSTGELIVTDMKTAEVIPAIKLPNKEKWKIKFNNIYKYFSIKEIISSALRRKIESTPQATLNIRNNVEATIFQLGYHYPNDKTRYRGLIKHKMWANIRCMWVNFVRIKNYVTQKPINIDIEQIYNPICNAITQIWASITIFSKVLSNQINSKTQIQFFSF